MDIRQLINNHIDSLEKTDNDIKEDINKLFQAIDVKELINNPDKTIEVLQLAIIKIMADKYIVKTVKEAVTFSKDVIKVG